MRLIGIILSVQFPIRSIMECEHFTHHVYAPPDRPGQWWELAVDPSGRLVWQQEIRGREWASSTDAVYNKLQADGACTRQPPPPQQQSSTVVSPSTLSPRPSITTVNNAAAADQGGIGLLLVLGLIGSAIWAWFNKGKDDYTDDYHPMSDVPQLPPVYLSAWTELQGNQAYGIPSEFADQLDRNSHEFDRNSQTDPSANSLGIPTVSANLQG